MKKQEFNSQWLFKKVDSKDVQIVDVPHDAMIHEKRDANATGGSGLAYFPGGMYSYEKTFDVPMDWKEQYVLFEFEGVYQNAKVYINDKLAGGSPYGYIPFTVCADNFINYGEPNKIKVLVDNSLQPSSRWYTGSGIYRPVWIYVGGKEHIEQEGVKISTLSYHPARIQVETVHTGQEVIVEILYNGQIVAKGSGACVELEIQDAKLWSDETPELYQCRVMLTSENIIVDELVEEFGIRKVEWCSKGLFVNGKETLLRGGCVHHDNGILGARSYKESEDRRVRILKKAGYNAIRSSHNPASKAMLSACDKYGVYMVDETWDMWYFHKSKHDYATHFMDWYKEDIKALVNRDFNHPSVIMYSIGNEVSEPKDEKGVNLTKEMVQYIHSLDNNRAVTCGINLMIINMASKGKGIYKEEGGLASDDKSKKKKEKATSSTLFNMMASVVGTGMNKAANSKKVDLITSPCLDELDIAGYNYASGRYPLEGKAHPERIIFGSETFPQDIAKNWAMVKKYPFLIGDFMWTSWDYIGEVGIGAWSYTEDGRQFNKPYPWILADAGAIDILGNIGAEAEYASVVWGTRKEPYIGIRPLNHPKDTLNKAVWRGTNAMESWSWKNCEGNKTIVEVYADAAKVKLFLNSKCVGQKSVKDYKALFKLRYAPGELMAIAYNSAGKETARKQLASAIGNTQIRVQPEKEIINTGEILYVNISLVGENGVVEYNADQSLSVKVENGELLALGSANPRTVEQYSSNAFTTYYGKMQAVVRCKEIGTLKINVSGEKLQTVTASIKVAPII
jgi:hypothetical protein